MKKWSLGLLLGLVAFSGCVSRTLEIDTRLGAKRDGNTGFFAYYTAAAPKPVEAVQIFVASEDSLLKPRIATNGESRTIYPIWVEESRNIFVPPSELARTLGAVNGPMDSSRESIELGYFMNAIQLTSGFPAHNFGEKTQVVSKGIMWATPNEKMEKKIREALLECRQVAAEYGANALNEVMVYYGKWNAGTNSPYGVWLYAKAVVYVEEQ